MEDKLRNYLSILLRIYPVYSNTTMTLFFKKYKIVKRKQTKEVKFFKNIERN